MNSINIIGRLTKDPEFKTSNNGLKFCNFSLAVQKPLKKDEVDFFNCTAFGKTSEVIEKYVQKGNQIAVTGSMNSNKVDKTTYWNVTVSSITLLAGNNNQSQQKHVEAESPKQHTVKQTDSYDDDEFPF